MDVGLKLFDSPIDYYNNYNNQWLIDVIDET